MAAMMSSLKAIARRWNKVKLLAALVQGVVYGAVLPFMLLIVSRLVPIMYSKWIAAAIWLLAIAAIELAIWLKRMKELDAAKLVDVELGEDSVLTALTLEEKQASSPLGQLVLAQALQSAKQYEQELPARIPWKRGWQAKRWIYLMSLTIFVVGVLFAVPNEQDAVAKQIKIQEEMKEEIATQLEEIKEQIEQSQLEEESKQELLASLEELLQKLDEQQQLEPQNSEELQQALEQLKEKTEEKQQQMEQLKQLNEGLAAQPSLQQLQQAMNKAMEQQGAEQQAELREALKQLSKEQSEALQQLAEQLAEQQPELSSLMQEASEQLASGSMNEQTSEQLVDALSELLSAEALSEMLSEAGSGLAQQLTDLSSSLAQTNPSLSQSLAEAVEQVEGSGQGAGQSQGNSQGEGEGAGQGEGNGEGQGEGSGSGQGQGNGQGAGNGSGQGQGNGQGSGSGAGAGQGGSGAGSAPGNHATITTPRIEGSSEVSVDGGPSSGGQTISGGISPMLEGQQGDYSEVFREYEAAAKDSLNRSTLPSHVQSKVQQYFDSIQPE